MAHIGANVRRPAETDLSVHVRAVHIDLASGLVNDVANLSDAFLEHAVRGGIRDHQAGQVVLVRFGLRAQIGDVDVAFFVAGDGDDS